MEVISYKRWAARLSDAALLRQAATNGPDGALGFWKALGEVWPTIREQRCWVHKTTNIRNKMPKSLRRPNARCRRSGWPRPSRPERRASGCQGFEARLGPGES